MSVGAVPVFVDIDPTTYNIDPAGIGAAVTDRTKAIVPVHIGGRPCDMDAISEIAKRHGLIVLEDAAHAHGSEWKGHRAGSIGDAGSFSFQSSKPLTCGEGGCIVTSDDKVRLRCWSILNGGRLPEREWYEHFAISTNGRLSQFQAAILNRQLKRLDEQIDRRSRNAARLREVLSRYDFIELLEPDPRITRDSHHFLIMRYQRERCHDLPRDRFIEALKAEGVPAFSGYMCLYKQPVFGSQEMVSRTGCTRSYDQLHLEHTETATEREAVWLPQKVLLGSEEQIESVGQAVGKIYAHATELL
jgi:dTDP-4-amino-4,6-dideoxygalactose transaminase